MAAKKVTRKQLLREPDEFITFTGRAIAFSREHGNTLAAVVGVLVAVGLLLTGIGWYHSRTRTKAMELYEQATARLAGAEQAGKAGPEALAAVEKDLQMILDQYGDTPAGALALMTMGDVAYEKGDFPGAAKRYEQAVEKFTEDPMSLALAQNGLAHSLEAAGELDRALSAYQSVMQGPNKALAQDASFRAAMVLKAQGKTQEAQKALADFAEQYPDSPFAQVAREELTSLGG